MLEVKSQGKDRRGQKPVPSRETSPRALLASPVAWMEEMAEGARPCTPQHSWVVILVTLSSSRTLLQKGWSQLFNRTVSVTVAVGMSAGSPGPAQPVPVGTPGKCP